ncbi:3-deoxy-D-manno-octulosonic acid transferase, partial [Salmonella enterica subsp. enterica serovar Infantis]
EYFGEGFVALGAKKNLVPVTGFLNFDFYFPPLLADNAFTIGRLWGPHGRLFFATRTQFGYDFMFFAAHVGLLHNFPIFLVFLLPGTP